MTTSQKDGLLDQTPLNVLDKAFEDALQEWLVKLFALQSEKVVPGSAQRDVKLKQGVNYALFSFDQLTQEGTPVTLEQTDDYQLTQYTATLNVQLTLYGPDCRSLAQFINDACQFHQNVHELQKIGLGFVDVSINPEFYEIFGQHRFSRVDLQISFNYTYRRKWAIRSLLEIVTKPNVSR